MITPIAPIHKTVYNTYSTPKQQHIIEELKEQKKEVKSTGNRIDIKV
ncbi:hypothetical protein ENKO_560 [Klebsiella phage fENko-Kae01]|nr:hypothetical protein [Klebsiella phage fENko-Kae01]WNV47656.1 hypothetical protein [Klebsiella phage fENko-Kae01]